MASVRESLRMQGRDYSLLAVAAMFVIFGLAVSNSVRPPSVTVIGDVAALDLR